MPDSRAPHKARRVQRALKWWLRSTITVSVGALVYMAASSPPLHQTSAEGSGGPSPVVTTTPTPAVPLLPEPTASPTPTTEPTPIPEPTTEPTLNPAPVPSSTPTPAPTLPAWQDWMFEGASLTIPKAGMHQVAITELQPYELVTKTYVTAAGEPVSVEAIDPANDWTVTWDTSVENGVRSPEGSVLSASAVNTIYGYCHDHADGSAICSTVYDVLVKGDLMTVETPTETLTYAVDFMDNIRKGDVPQSEELAKLVPGRFVLITCNSGGERNAQGETMENSVIVFQLVSASAK